MRCSACCFTTYFTLKLLTHSEKQIGHQSCVQSPGVISLCWYPCFLSLFYRSWCVISPACGRAFMSRRVSMCTYPSLVSFFSGLYCCTKLSGRLLSLRRVYSLLATGVFKSNPLYQLSWNGRWSSRIWCRGAASLWSILLWVCRNLLGSWLHHPLRWVVCGRGCYCLGDSSPRIYHM